MNLSELLAGAISIAKTDAQKVILPLLATFFTSISTDSSAFNVTVQLAKFNADLLAALPTIEHDVVAGIAAQINTAIAAIKPAA